MSFNIKKEKISLDNIPVCEEHGCPMIPVEQDGKTAQMCLFDAVYDLIGFQPVRYVKVSSRKIRSISFENGYNLEPLCPCCGEPTISDDGILKGKVLVGLKWGAFDYGENNPALDLEFAKTKDSPVTDIVGIDINSVCSLEKKGG
jgi:hypothetical protein